MERSRFVRSLGARDLCSASRPILVTLKIFSLGLFSPPVSSTNCNDILPASSTLWKYFIAAFHFAWLGYFIRQHGIFITIEVLGPQLALSQGILTASMMVALMLATANSNHVQRLMPGVSSDDPSAVLITLDTPRKRRRPYAKPSIVYYSLLSIYLISVLYILCSDIVLWSAVIDYHACVFCTIFTAYYYYVYVLNFLNEALFVGTVLFIWVQYKWFLDDINNLLGKVRPRQLDEKIVMEENYMRPKKSVEQEIRHLRHGHAYLAEFVNRVDRAFGPFEFAMTASNFFGSVHCIYGFLSIINGWNVMKQIEDQREWLAVQPAVQTAIYATRLLTVTACCHAATTSSIAVGQRVRQLSLEMAPPLGKNNCTNIEDIEKEIRGLMKEVKANPVRLSAWGFFNIDLKLFVSLVGAIITYLIILLQMR